jgi:RNA polymerase sigma-70 factor (ECF subfamily)
MTPPEAFRQAFVSGRAAWTGVTLAEDAFCRWAEGVGVDELTRHGGDLYLACACAAGDPVALAHLDTRFLATIVGQAGRVALTPQLADEVRQELRLRLIGGRGAGIGSYRGHAPLAIWVRVCATRIALRLASGPAHRALDAGLLRRLVAAGGDPEALVARAEHHRTLKEALETCFAALEPRDKTLLRLHYLDGLGLDELAVMLRVHRATVARRLAAIRRRVIGELAAQVTFTAGTTPSETNSLLRHVQSDIRLSLHRLLGEEQGQGGR